MPKPRRKAAKPTVHFQLRRRESVDGRWQSVKFETGDVLLGPFSLAQAMIIGPVEAAKIVSDKGYVAVEDMNCPLDPPHSEVDVCKVVGVFLSPASEAIDAIAASEWHKFNEQHYRDCTDK